MQLERRLRGKVAAADVVQEAYLRAVRFGPAFARETEGELLGWLRSILASRLAEEARRYGTRGRDVRLERELAAALEHSSRQLAEGLAAPDETPGRQAARRELGVLVADALGELPEHYRRAVVLRHLEGLGVEAMMARTGWTRDQALKYVQRGLIRLVQKLGKHA